MIQRRYKAASSKKQYGGLCLYEPPYNFGASTYSSCYMRMSGTDSELKPCLHVAYN